MAYQKVYKRGHSQIFRPKDSAGIYPLLVWSKQHPPSVKQEPDSFLIREIKGLLKSMELPIQVIRKGLAQLMKDNLG